MDANELRGLLPELKVFVKRFADCFSDRRSRDHLPVYLSGQLSDLNRKSVGGRKGDAALLTPCNEDEEKSCVPFHLSSSPH